MAGGGIKVNNITLNGGADGATFVPSVDNDGYLSWSNNKGYPNPDTVKIRGTTVVANPTESGTTTLTKLKVDNTVYNIPQGGGGSDINVVQTTGQSTTDVMSQNAVTEALNGKASTSYVQGNPLGSVTSTLNRLKIGDIIYTVPQGGGGGTTVVANPTLTGSEANLSGLQVGNTKYGIKALKVTIW